MQSNRTWQARKIGLHNDGPSKRETCQHCLQLMEFPMKCGGCLDRPLAPKYCSKLCQSEDWKVSFFLLCLAMWR